jgi:hypothetical protein
VPFAVLHQNNPTISCPLRPGFGVGAAAKFAFALLPALVRSRGNLLVVLKAFWKSLPDAVRYGSFIGGFLCAFESLMRLLQHW